MFKVEEILKLALRYAEEKTSMLKRKRTQLYTVCIVAGICVVASVLLLTGTLSGRAPAGEKEIGDQTIPLAGEPSIPDADDNPDKDPDDEIDS